MSDVTDPARWEGLATSVISDALNRFQVMQGGIRGLSGGRLFGPAYPVRAMVGENSVIHRAVAQAPPGAVLVVDAEGHVDRAVWGDVLTVAALAGGVAGAVVDGAVRDLEAIRERGFCLFARGVSAAGPHKGWEGTIGRPVQCGGVVVAKGDLVIGDGDGVVVVPAELVETTLEGASAARERERGWIDRIQGGETSARVLGLDGSDHEERNEAP
ncbi:MAG: RraA family protein [Actinomycetota bacterium]